MPETEEEPLGLAAAEELLLKYQQASPDSEEEVRLTCGFVARPVVLDVNFNQKIHTLWKDLYTPFAGNIKYTQVRSVLLSEHSRREVLWGQTVDLAKSTPNPQTRESSDTSKGRRAVQQDARAERAIGAG